MSILQEQQGKKMILQKGLKLVILLMLLVLVVGCSQTKAPQTKSPSMSQPESPAATPPKETPLVPQHEMKIGDQVITLIETELGIQPSEIKAKAGKVMFHIQNDGSLYHELKIEGKTTTGEEIGEQVAVPIGQMAVLTVELPPGTYEVYCPVPGHEENGMKATLVVE